MKSIIRKVKNFYKADKLYLVFSILKSKNIKSIPAFIKLQSSKRMKKRQKYFTNTGFSMIDIKTPDRMNQCVHPDIVKTQSGHYILAVTPYPFGDDRYEQPVIYRSRDLHDWEYISGPIDKERPGMKNHLSDPSIFQKESGELLCYYRECIYDEKVPVTNIYSLESVDGGFNWGKKQCLISEPMDRYDVISPSVKYDARGIHGYFCLKQGNVMKLMYTEGRLFQKDTCHEISLEEYLPDGKMLWHVSHLCNGVNDILLITLSEGFGGQNSQLYIGIASRTEHKLMGLNKVPIKSRVKGIEMEYRATGLIENGQIFVIDSVMFDDRTWGCISFEYGKNSN